MKVCFFNYIKMWFIILRNLHNVLLIWFPAEAHEWRRGILEKLSTLGNRCILKHASSLDGLIMVLHEPRLGGAHFIRIDLSDRFVSIDIYFIRSEE